MTTLAFLVVRQVSTSESLLRLQRFRYQIYIEELGKQLPWADHNRRLLAGPEDATALHFCATLFGSIVGCVRLHVSPNIPSRVTADLGLQSFFSEYSLPTGYISQLMIKPGLRGKGGALKLLAHLYVFGRSTGGVLCFNHCDPRLVRYYERMGLHKFGRPFIDPNIGKQIPMVQILEDEDHYRQKGSFLYWYCHKLSNDPASIKYLRNWFLKELEYKSDLPTMAMNKSPAIKTAAATANSA
jgi:hypothetical protein